MRCCWVSISTHRPTTRIERSCFCCCCCCGGEEPSSWRKKISPCWMDISFADMLDGCLGLLGPVCCVGVLRLERSFHTRMGGEGKEACLLPSLPASSARRVLLLIIDPNHTPTPLSHTRQARPLSCCPRVHGCSRAFDRGCSPIMISGEPTSQPPPSHALKLNQTPTPTHTTHTGIKPRPRLVPSPAPWTSESSYSRRYVRSYLPPFSVRSGDLRCGRTGRVRLICVLSKPLTHTLRDYLLLEMRATNPPPEAWLLPRRPCVFPSPLQRFTPLSLTHHSTPHPSPSLPQAIDGDSCRRRREEQQVQIRKQKREESLSQRRRMDTSPTPPVGTSTHPIAAGSFGPNVGMGVAAAGANGMAPSVENLPMYALDMRSGDAAREVEATRAIRKLLSTPTNPPVEQILAHGFLPLLVGQIKRENASHTLLFEASWALTNIGSTNLTRALVDGGATAPLVKLLLHPSADVREQCAWAVGNIRLVIYSIFMSYSVI